ncbi:MAG TPA: M15 family metallopeptidase [Nocardioides sp.]|nr:M15 family metallopeptidase [Nocardioides sp.]
MLRVLAAAIVLAAATACDHDETTATDNPSSTVQESPTAGADPKPAGDQKPDEAEVPPPDPDLAVEPPGPMEGPVQPADVLVFNQEPLSESLTDRIRGLEDVAAMETFGLGNVVIENRALNVAAVDPASFRRFAPTEIAQLQAVWERVAGGEISIKPALGKRFQNDDGEIALGSEKDAPTIHIGAYVPQTIRIDAVINEKWAEELGLQLGNAVLISTGAAAPESIRKPLQRIVGDEASIQNLDVAARVGLDPQAVYTAIPTAGTAADVVGTFNYTVIGGGRIAPEPSWVASHISTEVMPIIGPMTCNKAIFPQLRAALEEVVSRGLAGELHPDEYAGCYYPRFIAGTTTLSNHSFGTAMDFNVPGNQRGTVGEMNRDVVAIFKKWGFAWGGDWNYTDPMHFEMNAVVNPA